ncbi:MAG TPA: septum formation initiator family protein [Anaeromyxobacteraceae bacterium]|nr:septum formation initiator family protein [Anaeromyxobacteraceae bacterium]
MRNRPLLLYFAVLAALCAASALNGQGLRKAAELRGSARDFARENEQLRQEVERMRREVKALSGDPGALERAAREELGYVRSGEFVIQLDEPRGKP